MFAPGKPEKDIGIGFEYKEIDLIILSLPDLKFISTQRLISFMGINYGAFLLQEDGFNYIYRARRETMSIYLHVARVKGSGNYKSRFVNVTGWNTIK